MSVSHLPPLVSGLPPLTKIYVPTDKKNSSKEEVKQRRYQKEESEENESTDNESENDEVESERNESTNEEIENEEIQSKKTDKNASFFATFMDGSILRYLIEYLRLTSMEGTFIFKKDYITYQKSDEDNTLFNDVKIKTYELTDYEFSSMNSEIPVTINLSELRNKTRTVGKKDQMDIYRHPNESGNFYIQVRSQEKTGDNAMLYCMPMKNENMNLTIYQIPEYSRGKYNPNCTVHQSDFSKLCKSLVANKCTHVDFIGYDKGIIIKGIAADGKIVGVKEYGKVRNVNTSKTSTAKIIDSHSEKNTSKSQTIAPKLNIRDADEIQKFRIHISIIKCLSKINGFCNNGTIKFYIEAGVPMKLVIPIGTFGKMRILIRSSSN